MRKSPTQPRPRGRPRKDAALKEKTASPTAGVSFKAGNVAQLSHQKRPGAAPKSKGSEDSDDDHDFDEEQTLARRSKRYRAVDPTKHMPILRDSDDPVAVLGLLPGEIEEFNHILKGSLDTHDRSDSDGEDYRETGFVVTPRKTFQTPQKQSVAKSSDGDSLVTVLTPGVVVLREFSSGRKGAVMTKKKVNNFTLARDTQDISGTQQIITRAAGNDVLAQYYYGDYDIDETDDTELAKVNAKYIPVLRSDGLDKLTTALSASTLEAIIGSLERQLELSMQLSSDKSSCMSNLARNKSALETAEELVNSMEELCNNDVDMTKDNNCVKALLKKIQLSIDTTSSSSGASGAQSSAIHKCKTMDSTDSMAVDISAQSRSRGQKRKADSHIISVPSSHSLASLSVKYDDVKFGLSLRVPSPTCSDATDSSRFKVDTDRSIPAITRAQITTLVPFSSVSALLVRAIVAQYSNVKSSGDLVVTASLLSTVSDLAMEVYEYWASIRCSRKVSPLRCYHDYIMHNWSRNDLSLSEPLYPKDDDPERVSASFTMLQRLRRDLDRSRLIVDRIRRREKMKRDIFRMQLEAFESNQANSGESIKFELGPSIIGDDEEVLTTADSSKLVVALENFVPMSVYSPIRRGPKIAATGSPKRKREPKAEAEISADSNKNKEKTLVAAAATGPDEEYVFWKRLLLGVACYGLTQLDKVREEFGLDNRCTEMFLLEKFRTLVTYFKLGGHMDKMPPNAADYGQYLVPLPKGKTSKRILTLVDSFNEDEVSIMNLLTINNF
jgi:hypothetical protein